MCALQNPCRSPALEQGGPPDGRPHFQKAVGRFFDRFQSDKRGTVAAIFAMLTPIVFGIVGGAVDTGRWLQTRDGTLQAMDAAVLAAGRSMQVNNSTTEQAIEIARSYFTQNKPSTVPEQDVTFEVQENGTLVVAIANSALSTPFLSIIGITELPVTATSKAILAADGNAGTNIEISLMLDVTGSMCDPCSKMDALKAASKDLIDIVVWDDQSEYASRVALAPFATRVNVGRAFYKTVTKVNPQGNGDERTCVEERVKTKFLYSDKFPNNNRKFRKSTSWCTPQASIMPLSSDKDALKAKIDSLQTNGWTAGHLGIAWSWYMLAPNFNNVWPNSLGADADSYGDLNKTNTVTHGDATYEVPKLRKIAVLMTDGVFNKKYNGPDSNTQAQELCDEMKETGIEVYAVGFEVGTSGQAYDIMSYCASSDEHFYNAEDGNQLRNAFRDIGLKVSTLRISE